MRVGGRRHQAGHAGAEPPRRLVRLLVDHAPAAAQQREQFGEQRIEHPGHGIGVMRGGTLHDGLHHRDQPVPEHAPV
jgi:hypothetical protein